MTKDDLKAMDDVAVEKMTVRQALELACRSNPEVLAQLFMSPPTEGRIFTLSLNLRVSMDVREAQDAMKAAGFEVTIPPKAHDGYQGGDQS